MSFISSVFWLAMIVYGESRNQEHLDQLVVARVAVNRSIAYKQSMKEVALKSKQFSCLNGGVQIPRDGKALATSIEVAITALVGKDFTEGALFYHEKKAKPAWRHKVSFVGQYGDHFLYKKMVKIKADRRKIIF